MIAWPMKQTILLGLCLSLATCSAGSGSETGHTFQIFEEDGATISESSGGPKYDGEIFRFEAITTYQEDITRAETLLFRPRDILSDDGNRYFISDLGNSRIVVCDQDFRYLYSFGEPGEGPGAFQSLILQGVHDGVVSIFDPRSHRLSLFSTDGELLEMITDPGRALAKMNMYRLAPETCTWFRSYVDSNRESQESDSIISRAAEIMTVSTSGDTLWHILSEYIPTTTWFRYGSGSSRSSPIIFAGRPVVCHLPGDGLLVTTGVEPRLSFYNSSGAQYREIRLDLPEVPVTDNERSVISARKEEELRQARESGRRVEASELSLQNLYIPPVKAFWNDVIVDDAGYIWLLEPVDYSEALKINEFPARVLSPEGEYLGTTILPWYEGRICAGEFLAVVYPIETQAPTPTVFQIRSLVSELDYP